MATKHTSLESDHNLRTISGTRRTPQTMTPQIVMDVKGYGFSGGDNWWCYVLSHSEHERLDNLIGLALLDSKICEQLVVRRDPGLLSSFGLSEQTQTWLRDVKATTLKDLAQAIVAATKPSYFDAASWEAA